MKKILLWCALAAVMMLGLPWVAVTFGSESDMGFTILLLFVIDPWFCVLGGCFAGWNPKAFWMLPLIAIGFFLAGAWIFLSWGDSAFLLYSGCYVVVSGVAMLLSALVKKLIRFFRSRK